MRTPAIPPTPHPGLLLGKKLLPYAAIGLVALFGYFGYQEYRSHKASLLLDVSREHLNQARDLQALQAVGKLPADQVLAQVQSLQEFLETHPDAELLAEFPETRLTLAEICLKQERWAAAGNFLAKVRPLASEKRFAHLVGKAHLLMAEAAAPFAHLAEFTKLATASAEHGLAAEPSPTTTAAEVQQLRQRLALVQAHLAGHAAGAAWQTEEQRLLAANKEAQSKAKRLSTTLQKEMKEAFTTAAEALKTAATANDPAAVDTATKAKAALQLTFTETLARREEELRGSLLKDFQASPALSAARQRWSEACQTALALAQPQSANRLQTLTMLLESRTTPLLLAEAAPIAQELEPALAEKLSQDPDHQGIKSTAALGLLRLGEFLWLQAQVKTGDSRTRRVTAAEKHFRQALGLVQTTDLALAQQIAASLSGLLEEVGRPAEPLDQALTQAVPTSQTSLVTRVLARERQKAAILRATRKPAEAQPTALAAAKLADATRTWHQTLLSTTLLGQQSQVLANQTADLRKLCQADPETKDWATVLPSE